MKLKRHKDFLNESLENEYHGYIGKELMKKLPVGTELKHVYINDFDPAMNGENGSTLYKVSDLGFSVIDIVMNKRELQQYIDDPDKLDEDHYSDDVFDFDYDELDHDERGYHYKDEIHGGKSYFKFADDRKNLDQYKVTNKYKLTENIYDDKLSGKATDLSYLLKQLKELIHNNDSYKANVKMDGDKIVVEHEVPEKKQRMILKDNGQQNDFFYISGTDDKGESIDDMGEQPSEVIFVQIAKLFQEA
jgi:hypothetical protein